MSTPYAVAFAQLSATVRTLRRGFEPEWGWWVSDDGVRRIYSSHSPAQAEENWIATQPERMTQCL